VDLEGEVVLPGVEQEPVLPGDTKLLVPGGMPSSRRAGPTTVPDRAISQGLEGSPR
jgi:hypothetical protein